MAVTIDGLFGFQILLVSDKISVAFEVVGLVFFLLTNINVYCNKARKL